ncbi:hypothetical protein GCK32_002233 [Trichostrongylus colubriformis]|uniref:Uncharacterized protein n=1 Tax=Trichostrongylus colubriformis TaxID=6319 RepID=A0AAN8G0F9_TRICO
MNPTRLALIIALLFLNATCSLECTRCDLYTSGNLPACCLTFTPPKQVVVWYGTQNGGGMQQTAGGVISNVGSSGQVARPGNLPQSQQMIPSGYQQGMQGSNPPTYLSPQQQSQHPQQPQQQQQQQGSLGLAPSPNYNAQAGNTFQGQGIQNAPEGVQYQPVNQDSTGYNGANTGLQTVSVTAFSQTGGDYNQPSNPSNMQVSQGVYREGQQVWNPQNPPGLIPSQPGSVNAGAQNQGPYIPQQPQRDEQISSTGQPTPYQVTENYDETQRIAGSSSDGRTPTTASPPFTQAPYSRPDTPTQGVFPTVSIGVYSGQTPTTSGTTSGFQSSVSGMPYTPTSSGTTSPFQSSASGMPYTSTSPPYGSSQYAEQGSTSQGVINPSQGIYGTPTSNFGNTQSGSSMGPGQFTPSPYQSSVSQPSSSGYTPSSPTGQYTYQYDQGQTQTSPYVALNTNLKALHRASLHPLNHLHTATNQVAQRLKHYRIPLDHRHLRSQHRSHIKQVELRDRLKPLLPGS